MRLLPHLAACCALALLAGTAVPRGTVAAESEAPRVKQGFKIAPVKLKLKGLNPDLVGLGSYLVNAAGGCNDCHSVETYAPGGDPFAGEPEKINKDTYLAGGRDFGIAVSPNLTPNEKGRPAGLTYKQFFNAIKFGKDPHEKGEILQVMPWPVFSKLTDRDIRALYEYLSAIPSLETPAPPTVTTDGTEPETTTGEELPPTAGVEETTEPTGEVTEPTGEVTEPTTETVETTEPEDTTESGEPTVPEETIEPEEPAEPE